MAINRTRVLPCPRCGRHARFSVIMHIDADRQPDRRNAIINRTLQKQSCDACGAGFRMPPDFTYFDRARNQWIAAYPWEQRADWPRVEDQARSNLESIRQSESGIAARMREAPLNSRVTFGWEALREKIIAARLGLDDVTLELFKRDEIRRSGLPAAPDEDLRLFDGGSQELILGRIVGATEDVVEQKAFARGEFDAIAAAEADSPGRRALSAGTFVDVRRLREDS